MNRNLWLALIALIIGGVYFYYQSSLEYRDKPEVTKSNSTEVNTNYESNLAQDSHESEPVSGLSSNENEASLKEGEIDAESFVREENSTHSDTKKPLEQPTPSKSKEINDTPPPKPQLVKVAPSPETKESTKTAADQNVFFYASREKSTKIIVTRLLTLPECATKIRKANRSVPKKVTLYYHKILTCSPKMKFVYEYLHAKRNRFRFKSGDTLSQLATQFFQNEDLGWFFLREEVKTVKIKDVKPGRFLYYRELNYPLSIDEIRWMNWIFKHRWSLKKTI